MMKLAKFLPLLALAACTDNATKQESVQIFAAATTAMSTAQTKAVDEAKGASQLTDPAMVTLDYSGACSLGGQVTVKGNYNGEGSNDRAAFDLETSFAGCHEPTGTIDGKIHWTSTASSAGFSAAMDGSIDWAGNNGSASCDFDLSLAVTMTSVNYSGHLCGYDVGELVLGGN